MSVSIYRTTGPLVFTLFLEYIYYGQLKMKEFVINNCFRRFTSNVWFLDGTARMLLPASKLHLQVKATSCHSKFVVHEVMNCCKSKGSFKRLHWKFINIFSLLLRTLWKNGWWNYKTRRDCWCREHSVRNWQENRNDRPESRISNAFLICR